MVCCFLYNFAVVSYLKKTEHLEKDLKLFEPIYFIMKFFIRGSNIKATL